MQSKYTIFNPYILYYTSTFYSYILYIYPASNVILFLVYIFILYLYSTSISYVIWLHYKSKCYICSPLVNCRWALVIFRVADKLHCLFNVVWVDILFLLCIWLGGPERKEELEHRFSSYYLKLQAQKFPQTFSVTPATSFTVRIFFALIVLVLFRKVTFIYQAQ